MRYLSCLIHSALVFTIAGSAGLSRADEVADKGREIFKKHQYAVVTVQVVLKISSSGTSRSSESRQEITGTVVDPSGLTVLALSACDPSDIYRLASGQNSQKVEIEVTDLKILLGDGTEVPAQIVLRDKDLDLAFVRPKSKLANPLPAVDFAKAAPAQLLDEVVTLTRLNSAAGRAYSASVERISGVIQKPRTFYIPDSRMSSTALGSPAFSLDGNLVGLVVMRAVSGKGGGGNSYRDNTTSIILPAGDVLKAAQQAPEAKAESDKKEEPAGAPASK
jgi:hypothetical protein